MPPPLLSPYFYIPNWPVFHEDNHLLVLYKPAGLLIQGDDTGDATLMDLVRQWIKTRYEKPGRVFLGLVHRLDRPVAGVVVFARTSKAAGRLSEQFREGRTEKQYMAVLEGIVTEKEGRLIHHVERRGSSGRVVDHPTAASQEARLTYRLLDTFQSRSLVEIDLETGRHHQIRLQFAHLGCPVAGDLRYGAPAPLPDRQIALFARRLSVFHPTQNAHLTFSCPLPKEWPWPNSEKEPNPPFWNWRDVAADFPF